MESKGELRKLLSDVTWERQMCPVTKGSNLLVDMLAKKAFDWKSSVEIPEALLGDPYVVELVKNQRIKITGKKGKLFAYLYRLGKLVAMGEMSLRLRERKNAVAK